MRDMPLADLQEVAEAFRAIALLSEQIFRTSVEDARVPGQIEEDAAIIAYRIASAQALIDQTYPGFSGLVLQSDREVERKAQVLLAQRAAQQRRH